MKIVQLITGSPAFGGAESHVRDLSIGLKSRGHECIVMLGPPEGLLSEQLRSNGLPVVIVPALRKPFNPVSDVASLLQVSVALRRLRPDVLATHTSKAGFIGRIAARLEGIPSFFTPHGLSFINRRTGRKIGVLLLLEQIASLLGGRIIAVCEAERNLALKYLRMKSNRVVTIHNGLPDHPPRGGASKPSVRIAMVARFHRQKDHPTLLNALAKLKHLDWELRLAGAGPLLPSAKRLVEQHGLSSRVHFLNQCSDTAGLLAETDIFALATNWEAFPISILEAMRAALPVIATDTGGISEAVEDGRNGFLVRRADASLLAEKLVVLITSPALRASMGFESRKRFVQRFEWRSMLDRTEAIYAHTLLAAAASRMASATSA